MPLRDPLIPIRTLLAAAFRAASGERLKLSGGRFPALRETISLTSVKT
jgi:hypothetical protein